MDQTEQPTLEPRPGPGAIVPKLLAILGSLWLMWLTIAAGSRLGCLLNSLSVARPRNRLSLSPLLSLFD